LRQCAARSFVWQDALEPFDQGLTAIGGGVISAIFYRPGTFSVSRCCGGMQDLVQKFRGNLSSIIVVAVIALTIVAVFKVNSWGSGGGPAIEAGPVDPATQ
jgi:hypothetical protein